MLPWWEARHLQEGGDRWSVRLEHSWSSGWRVCFVSRWVFSSTMAELDLVNRDPNNINDHLKVGDARLGNYYVFENLSFSDRSINILFLLFLSLFCCCCCCWCFFFLSEVKAVTCILTLYLMLNLDGGVGRGGGGHWQPHNNIYLHLTHSRLKNLLIQWYDLILMSV